MKSTNLKYLIAYIGPLAGFLSVAWAGYWSYAGVILTFVLIPLIDHFLPGSLEKADQNKQAEKARNRYYDWLLYSHVPLLYALIVFYLFRITQHDFELWEIIGMTLSTGIMVGAFGINVAHELGHRKKRYERVLAQLLLLPALYMHFYVEHNRGHHRYVATPEDPATARFGENVYSFWLRSIVGSWRSAWQIDQSLVRSEKGRSSTMWRFTLLQVGYLLGAFIIFGATGLLAATVIGIIAILLLETINYIEHYGLLRSKTPRGTYERVGHQHSWDSDHHLGRIFLYELTRHAHHHHKASLKYQVLEYSSDSPQMPTGYPAMMLISLIPPVFFKLMNPRVPEAMIQSDG